MCGKKEIHKINYQQILHRSKAISTQLVYVY